MDLNEKTKIKKENQNLNNILNRLEEIDIYC